MLATSKYLQVGDEMHVPISKSIQNGIRTPVAGVIAVMQYVSRNASNKEQTDWVVQCASINVHGRPLTGQGPKEFASKLENMGLEGPRYIGWANKVNFVRSGQLLGTVQEVKERECL